MKTKTWKNSIGIILLFFAITPVFGQVGIGTTSPDTSSALDINVANKGLLIPRVALSGTNDLTTIANPATSLLVYNTAPSGSGITAVTPGFYYFDGSQWNTFSNSNTGDDWSLDGNSGTDSNVNYVGTSDSQDLSIATNATPRLRIDDNNFQIKAMGNGSQNRPFYSWDNDTNTGLWRKGGDQLGLGAGNLEFITLSESNSNPSELIINEDNDADFDVNIKGATENNLLYVDGSANAIGIGKSNPTSRLDVFSDNGFAITSSGRIKGIFSRSQTANIGSSGGSFILDIDSNPSNGHLAEGVMAGVLVDGSIVGAYGRVYRPDNNWGLYTVNNGVALQFFTFSDSRLKTNINDLESSIDKIMALRPVTYTWDSKKHPSFGGDTRKQIGFLSQELEQVFPELVNKSSVVLPNENVQNTEEKFDAVSYDGLIPVLTKALQEQQKVIEQLNARIEVLENK